MENTLNRKTTSSPLLKAFLFLLLPVALLSGCEGPNLNGLTKETKIHAVGTQNKMSNLLKEAEQDYGESAMLFDNGFSIEATPGGAEGSGSSRDYVDTNEQVAGVKEGDVIKTDGYQIFYAPRYSNVIHVVMVEDNYLVSLEQTIELGTTYVDSMYLLEDYLVVIGYGYDSYVPDESDETLSYMWWSPTGTVIVIDRTDFTIAYELALDSFFMDHRIIDNTLFLLSHKYVYFGEVDYEQRPTFVTTKNDQVEVDNLDYNSIFYFDDTPAYGMNVMTAIKLAADEEEITYNASAYLGASADYKKMYVDTENIYLAETIYHYDKTSYFTTMTISQFAIDVENATSHYVAAIIVLGTSLNQFSMDVYEGHLRVATTDRKVSLQNDILWWFSNSEVTNHLYVLRVNEELETFDLVGHLSEGLGKPGEDIKSVRFDGEMAYVVTFLLTDPLYIIDLSNPATPHVSGEIIQEGFDTYQHAWNDGYLIGIGYDADTNGIITGMKISAYNVNQNEEQTIQTFNIFSYQFTESENWSYGFSEALYNHKAILVSVEQGYLGFAVQGYEYGYHDSESGREYYSIYHSYYYLFKIDFTAENPIGDPIIIEHPDSEEYYLNVDRGILIDDYLYTLSNKCLITYSLAENEIVEPTLFFDEVAE
ncbi:MAG: beta-propeller domain-containing protein [Bacilli bacterium]|jgi:uncharacterized secreted protein with C-terminal beta-propeller domain